MLNAAKVHAPGWEDNRNSTLYTGSKCKPMINTSLSLIEVVIRILILRPLKGKGRVLIRVYINVESYLARLPQETRLCKLLQKPPQEQ